MRLSVWNTVTFVFLLGAAFCCGFIWGLNKFQGRLDAFNRKLASVESLKRENDSLRWVLQQPDTFNLYTPDTPSKTINIVSDDYPVVDKARFLLAAYKCFARFDSDPLWQHRVRQFQWTALYLPPDLQPKRDSILEIDCGSMRSLGQPYCPVCESDSAKAHAQKMHSLVPQTAPTTYFNSTFDYAGTHRLCYPYCDEMDSLLKHWKQLAIDSPHWFIKIPKDSL